MQDILLWALWKGPFAPEGVCNPQLENYWRHSGCPRNPNLNLKQSRDGGKWINEWLTVPSGAKTWCLPLKTNQSERNKQCLPCGSCRFQTLNSHQWRTQLSKEQGEHFQSLPITSLGWVLTCGGPHLSSLQVLLGCIPTPESNGRGSWVPSTGLSEARREEW